jgi:hypothetical protein
MECHYERMRELILRLVVLIKDITHEYLTGLCCLRLLLDEFQQRHRHPLAGGMATGFMRLWSAAIHRRFPWKDADYHPMSPHTKSGDESPHSKTKSCRSGYA